MSELPPNAHGELRPHAHLMIYYAALSALAGPFFPIPLLFYFFRYRTLRYRFDEEGVSMRWGALFRREIRLNYARIQDIHLVSNFLERWLGLGRVQLQTASGAAAAEMVIEGLREFEEIRDLLYRKMLGETEDPGDADPAEEGPAVDAAVAALREAAAELRQIRALLAGRQRVAPGEEPR
ncbi:MAG: PH domain-containing protein [Thermoanaerobaculia bacterium]|nr:PH domain-containing protein [Thermoanaerobaculia bacterium]